MYNIGFPTGINSRVPSSNFYGTLLQKPPNFSVAPDILFVVFYLAKLKLPEGFSGGIIKTWIYGESNPFH
jgi:hypothetical protein